MDRDEIVRLCRKVYIEHSNLTTNEVNNVISSYCEEKGKKYAEIQLLLTCLYKDPITMNNFFIEALSYYERKYTLFKLESQLDIRNPGSGRRVLLIF